MSRDETMFDRWARRKRAVAEAEAEAKLAPPPADETPAEQLPDAELLEKLGLPDPDSLASGDDFAAFMRAEVPDFLRRRALKRLWLSNPDLANLDGLLDYGDDFTDAAMVPKVMNTLYQVGKGMLREKPDLAAADGTAAVETGVPTAQADRAVPDLKEEPEKNISTFEDDDPESREIVQGDLEPFDIEQEESVYRPRRMRFS